MLENNRINIPGKILKTVHDYWNSVLCFCFCFCSVLCGAGMDSRIFRLRSLFSPTFFIYYYYFYYIIQVLYVSKRQEDQRQGQYHYNIFPSISLSLVSLIHCRLTSHYISASEPQLLHIISDLCSFYFI